MNASSALVALGATAQLLASGCEWTEGPTWLPSVSRLRFSDIPSNRIMEFDAASGTTRVHRDDVGFVNGRTLDIGGETSGAVVQCSHGGRSVEREVDGVVTIIVDRWAGGRFNSPNDVVVASDGAIWFTDPPYGLHPSGREGYPGEQDYDGCFVFRFDPVTGVATPVITDMVHPNGLAFSPDGTVLYVADTGFFGGVDAARHIRAYDVAPGAGGSDGPAVSNGRDFAVPEPGPSDGFRVDVEGRIWTSSGPAVQVFSPSGEALLTVELPERVSNLCFGGEDGHDVYVTASTSLYRIRSLTTQAARA